MRWTIHGLCLLGVVALVCASSLTAGIGGGSHVRTHVIGGNAVEAVTGMKILPSGDIAVCGYTNSGQDATVPGLRQDAPGGQDAFIAVLSSDLSTLKYWTYYGGANDDKATAMAVMPDGTIVVTGETSTRNLTMSVGAFAQLHGGEIDGFVLKLSSDLDSLFFSSYIPGSKDERPTAVLVDGAGSVYVCGTTNSQYGFPTNNGYDRSFNGGVDAFVLKMSPNGGSLAFSTYFGGDGTDAFRAMTLTGDGGIALTGYTASTTYECFPVRSQWWLPWNERPYDNTYNGGLADAVLTIMSQDGARLIASSFFGGAGDDYGNVIHADVRGDLFIAGSSSSPDLPTVFGGAQANLQGGSDGFLALFDPKGMSLQASSFLGGAGNDAILQAVSSANNVWTLLGSTTSRDLSGIGGGTSGDVSGASDLFIARGAISGISCFTTFGWRGTEMAAALAEDSRGDAYIAGSTDASSITWSGGTIQNAGPIGTAEGFVAKWAYGTLDLLTPRGGERVCTNQTLSVTWATLELGVAEEFQLEISSDGITWSSAGTALKNRSMSWKVPTTLVLGTQYLLRIISSHGHVSQASGTFTLREPTAIVIGPESSHVCTGESVVLNVTATGEGNTYQWKRNGAVIPNATSPQLSLPNIPASKAGSYEAVVTSACGFVTSKPAQVVVDADVTITEQPIDKQILVGHMLTLMVRAQGLDITYKWLHNDEVVLNAVSAELRIPSVALAHAGEYRVIVAGKCGTDTSHIAVVEVSTNPVTVQDVERVTFFVAPNPASHIADVTVTAPSTVTITDLRGEIVLTCNAYDQAMYPAKIHLNLEPLAIGTYVVSDGISVRLLKIVR